MGVAPNDRTVCTCGDAAHVVRRDREALARAAPAVADIPVAVARGRERRAWLCCGFDLWDVVRTRALRAGGSRLVRTPVRLCRPGTSAHRWHWRGGWSERRHASWIGARI